MPNTIISNVRRIDRVDELLRNLRSQAGLLHLASTSEDYPITDIPNIPSYFDNMERELDELRNLLEKALVSPCENVPEARPRYSDDGISSTELQGRDLAVDMLRHIKLYGDECDRLDPKYNEEKLPQINVVKRYFENDMLDEPDFRQGFTAVLTDYLACVLGGAVPDLEVYERLNREAGEKS